MSGEPQEWVRADDNAEVDLADALAWHVDFVRRAGSPVAALVVEAVLGDLRAGGVLAGVLPRRVRFGDLVALRVMAAVHRLAIERRAPRVALHLPTLGGLPPATEDERDRFRGAVVDALIDHEPVLRASITHTPQTNETGRAALLRCVLSRVDVTRPVRLREIGASAGLNLRADHLPGLPGLEAGPMPPILDRIGCDLHPVDPTSTEGRTTLSSYVWVDDVDRFERLRRALAVAASVPASVVTADAADFAESLELLDGTTTVLWHSAFWTYLPDDARARISAAIERLGSLATASRPFVHASWEFSGEAGIHRPDFVLTLRSWSGAAGDGAPRTLAAGNSHGSSATLLDGH